ncbi:MBL fold metallo-hydrolase [Alteraurantiacibacter aquimixticola]|uniref:MBL fold metallo-hydrolase n=1 Tax=Alteraurantiacibacter aquimixticola TaxID=2489173 RepID=A0A4T3F406_9SPHN|nr:MBL fold metallo-hydrolase [Alteraurantiacibacter aquimixticola]TIX50248.1 MBL fold metallo-hydrolase [Alteraurantiacibacter aquimixticola]
MSAKTFATAALLALTGCATTVPEESRITTGQQWADQCEDWDEWDKPGPAFLVHGSTYYVGTCGIATILIAGESSHVLFDSGTEEGARVTLSNIRSLGFDPADIDRLFTSHEHYDHVGGMALLQEGTGATVYTSPGAAEVLRSGNSSRSDPQASIHPPMTPVADVRVMALDQPVRLQSPGVVISATLTPGHTPGAMTWQWESCDEAGECLSIVYADSLSPVSADGYRFSDHPQYLTSYRAGLNLLTRLDCDILLTPHPSASGMRDKLLAGDLTSGMNCADYAASITERLDARIAEEAQGNP